MAERLYSGEPSGEVSVREGAQRHSLDPRLDLPNGGSKSARLALALLADALGDDERAIQLHQEFTGRVVEILPRRWTITRSRIIAHVYRFEANPRPWPELRASA